MRLDLQNKTLWIGINANPPFLFIRRDDEQNRWLMSGGIEGKLVNLLADYFNFSFETINCHRTWGSRLPNGTWNGLIRLLLDQKVDFGVGGTSMNYARSQAVNYLTPHLTNPITFITPPPQHHDEEGYHRLVFQPLEWTVWKIFLLALAASIVFEWIVHRVWPEYQSQIFWISLVLMLRQHPHRRFDIGSPLSVNLWLVVWNFGMFTLTTAYAGCLCSLITVPTNMNPIDTVAELHEAVLEGRITAISIANSYYTEAIKTSNITILAEIGRESQLVADENEGFKKILSGNEPYAFITLRDSLHYSQIIFGEDNAYLPPNTINSAMFYDLLAIPTRPGFEYYAQFDKIVKTISASGILWHWKQEEYLRLTRTRFVLDDEEVEAEPFDMDHLKSFFLVYTINAFVALIAFMVEIIWEKCGHGIIFDTTAVRQPRYI